MSTLTYRPFDAIRWRNQAKFNQMCYKVNDQIKATLFESYSQFWAEVEDSVEMMNPRAAAPVDTIVVRGRQVKVSEATQHIVDATGQLSMFDDSGAFSVSAKVGTPEWENQIDELFARLDENGNVPAEAQPQWLASDFENGNYVSWLNSGKKPAKSAKPRVKLSKPVRRVKLVSKTPKLSPQAQRRQAKDLACVIGLATFAVIMLINVAL